MYRQKKSVIPIRANVQRCSSFTRPLHSHLPRPSSFHITPPLVVSSLVSSVPDYLHPTDHLTNCEKPQNLSTNNSSLDHLFPVHFADRLHYTGRVGGGLLSSLLGGLEEGIGVSYALDETLEVGLECGDRSAFVSTAFKTIEKSLRRAHVLALEDQLGELHPDARVVEHWWDLSCINISH